MNREELEQKTQEVKQEIKELEGFVQVRKYKRAKQERKQLKKQLKDLPSLEVGKWYKTNELGSPFLIFITKIILDSVAQCMAYGFCHEGEWYDNSRFGINNLTPATDKEVEEALIKEANKRGFKEGVNADLSTANPCHLKNYHFLSNDFEYSKPCNWLSLDGVIIFEDGKWAEIIEQPKELPNSWEEFRDICRHPLPPITGLDDRYKALRQLELLRDCYNDGWVADELNTAWCLGTNIDDKIQVFISSDSRFLNFKTAELRDKFLKNFKDIIEIAKPLL